MRPPLIVLLAAVVSGSSAWQCGALAADREDNPPPSIASSLPDNGDPGGVRKWLGEHGITYGALHTSEILGNVSGGIRRGAVAEDKLDVHVAADLEKLAGLKGLSFYSNGFLIHGTGGLARDYVGNLITISNIEALPYSRLSELWLEQKLFDDKVSVRAGQLTSDAEFFISTYSTLFINSGWPAITALDLPSSGPVYPLATPGIRLKYQPSENVTALASLFNGDPAGPGPGNPQDRDPHGLNFRVQDPPLMISELQYRYNQSKAATGLAGEVKLGWWQHFGLFNDQRFAGDGLSLANPASGGVAARLRGDHGVYGVIDQQVYRPPGGEADSGIAIFGRISASPSDRNLIDFYLDGGVTVAKLVPGRPDDKFGATFVYARISDSVRALDLDRIALSGAPAPIRDYEMTIELTYQAQVVPGWTIQPDFQYVFHPGGHAPDPNNPSTPIKDAAVLGVRSTLRY